MKITFLGTSAATSCPLPFCNCLVCKQSRIKKGKDFRKRSSLLINEDLLIDFGPDIMTSSFMHNVSIEKIKYCLQTHSHSDHFDASQFSTRIPEYAVENIPPLKLYASKATLIKMSEMLKNEGYISNIFDPKEQQRMNLKVSPVNHFQSFKIGTYQIMAFPSNHDESVDPLIYTIEENGLLLLYGLDSDIFLEETWSVFHQNKLKFDIVILDHTYGPKINGESHLNANKFIEHIERMKKKDLLSKNVRIFASHISHEGNPNHDKFVEFAKPYNYEIAYDGLIINLNH